jgi:hypothetical protein
MQSGTGSNPPLSASATLTNPPSGATGYDWKIVGGNGAIVFPNGQETMSSTTPSITLKEPNPTPTTVPFDIKVGIQYPSTPPTSTTESDPLLYGPTEDVFPGIAITSIDPTVVMVGSNSVQMTIKGFGFGNSPTVNFPAGVTSSNQQSSDTQIVVTLSVDYSAAIGSANISVTANGQTSNTKQVILNGPAYAKVLNDTWGQDPSGNPERVVNYQVCNADNSVASGIPIGEDFIAADWSCTNASQPPTSTTLCSDPYTTSATGAFTDVWSYYGTYYTPPNCGVNVTDHWQWCTPSGSKSFMTLTGFIHTVDSDINRWINPPNQIPEGTIIKP